MKMIIISPTGEQKCFFYNEFAKFHHWLFACLAGVPKRVTVEIDTDFNEIYRISYAD